MHFHLNRSHFFIREIRELFTGHDPHDAAMLVHVSSIARDAGFQKRSELRQRVALENDQWRCVQNLLGSLVMAVDATDKVNKSLPRRLRRPGNHNGRGWNNRRAGRMAGKLLRL